MIFRGFMIAGVFFIFLLNVGCAYVKNDDELFFDDLMQDYYGNGTDVPGASVLVMCRNTPIIRRSYGSANIEEQTRVESETNFRLASVTKQFTAAAILLLVEREDHVLQLDDRIREKWLPSLPEVTTEITVRHLLTHTSGLIDYEDVNVTNDDPDQQLSDADVLKILSTQNRTYFTPPGSQYRYSNSGYALLALIVEKVSGQRFATFLHERIFAPLDMNGTVAYEKGISTVDNRAYGHSYNGSTSTWILTDQSRTSAVLGDGGIYSSIDDLAKWDTALYDNRLLTNESLNLAFTPAVRTDDPGTRYGMGWEISGDMLWHSGQSIGFRNIILRFPKRRLTVVILTNRYVPSPYQAALTVAHRFLFDSRCNTECSTANSLVHSKALIIFWFLMGSFFLRHTFLY